MLYATVILQVTQNENSWTADDLILFYYWFSCHSKTRLWTETLIPVFLFLINVTVQLALKMEFESVSFRISHQVILSEIKIQNLNYQNPS